MSGQIKGDQRETVKEMISILSSQNITPYDLLLALDKQDIVPDDIAADRKQRIQNRGASPSPQEYIKNALEDLKDKEFLKKDKVIPTLEGLVKKGGLGDYTLGEPIKKSTSMWLILALLLVLVYLKKRKPK